MHTIRHTCHKHSEADTTQWIRYHSELANTLLLPKLGPKIHMKTHIPSMAKTTVPNKTYAANSLVRTNCPL